MDFHQLSHFFGCWDSSWQSKHVKLHRRTYILGENRIKCIFRYAFWRGKIKKINCRLMQKCTIELWAKKPPCKSERETTYRIAFLCAMLLLSWTRETHLASNFPPCHATFIDHKEAWKWMEIVQHDLCHSWQGPSLCLSHSFTHSPTPHPYRSQHPSYLIIIIIHLAGFPLVMPRTDGGWSTKSPESTILAAPAPVPIGP